VRDPDVHGRRRSLRVPVVPDEHPAGDVGRAARDQPGGGEQAGDGDQMQHVEHRFVKLADALNPIARPVSTFLPRLNVDRTRLLMWHELTERLEGRLIVLEPILPEHRETLRAAAADPALWRWMQVDASIPEGFDHWFEHALREVAAKREVPFATV